MVKQYKNLKICGTMALYEKHQKLKKDLDQTVEEWETVSMELEEMQGS